MAWKKVVERIGVGGCPKCQNPGFDYQEDADRSLDENAPVQCPSCGWKGILREMVIVPTPKAN